MKKIILYFLLIAMLLLPLLVGCNNEPAEELPDDGQAEQTDDPGEPTYDPATDNEAVATLSMIADGASDYVIVRGKDASPAEVTAASELQAYLKQISGVELPIVTDDQAAIRTEIVVGKTNREADGEFDRKKLGDDGFTIKTRAHRLFLVGGEQRGTLYAVYEFLEAYMGCRFYTADFEKVPENKTVTLSAIEGDTQTPEFSQRILYSYDYLYTELNGSVFSAKRKINLRRWGVYDDAYGGSQIWAGHPCHSMQYSLGDLASKYPGRLQPCLTDEEVYQQILSDALQWLEQTPGAEVISISQKDTESYCRCENCAALEEEYGSYAGVILTFVNRIAEEIAQDYPDVWIHTMAYRGTDACPDGIEPADNVLVELGAVYECNRHPLETADECTTTRSSVPFNQKLEEWGEICMNDNLFITYFTTDFFDYSLSYPDFEVLRQDIRLFADNGAKSLMVHGNYQCVSLEFEELRSYLASKLMWDPYMSADEYEALMMEFLVDFYGPGAESIREYITVMHEESEDRCIFMQSSAFDMYDLVGKSVQNHASDTVPDGLTADMIRDYENVDWSQYVYWYSGNTPRIISEGERLFAQALTAAETDEQRARIERCSKQIDVLRSYHLYLEKNKTSSFVSRLFGTGIPAVFPDEFTKQELTEIKTAVAKLIITQVADAYVEYNETLAQTMQSYNTYVREAEWTPYPDDPEKRKNNRNYAEVPTNWLVQ
ncbi:MAG: DUF4838 domain-containing protein [Clostridia bacterium]|nr:DUF4838 domain-containing protein [Clostridia bacterium]